VAPEAFEIDPGWSRELGALPAELKPQVAWERLQAIAERRGIEVDSLTPHFQAYAQEHALQPPFFSFPCDSHFSALGHRVLADAILEQLDARGLLPARTVDRGPWSADRAQLFH
jgi:hypothetical protein